MNNNTPAVQIQPFAKNKFLKDVFLCLLSAFGGQETHFSVLLENMAIKKKYVTQSQLIELLSLCSMLPGPTSTQLIISLSYKLGGPRLALPAMAIWVLPSLTVMSALAILYQLLQDAAFSMDVLRFIAPMAVGFIMIAAYRMGRAVITSRVTAVLFVLSALALFFIGAPWLLPLLLLSGGIATAAASGEKGLWHKVRIRPPWWILAVFLFIALGSIAAAAIFNNRLVELFDSFYRFGYLVFGGGQVAVPLMYSDLVDVHHYMTGQEFMAGYGLSQGIPGPMFSFSGYAGGLAARGDGIWFQVIGAMVCGVAIFLPGVLLIFFVYPIWENLKQVKGIRISMLGISAVAGGLVAGMCLVLLQLNGWTAWNLGATAIAALLVLWGRIPTPIIVAGTLALGYFLPVG
jgi:chromate transporter